MKLEVFTQEKGALRLSGEQENYPSGVDVDDFVLTTKSSDAVTPFDSSSTHREIEARPYRYLVSSDNVALDLLSNACTDHSFVRVMTKLADSDEWVDVCQGKVTLEACGEYMIR